MLYGYGLLKPFMGSSEPRHISQEPVQKFVLSFGESNRAYSVHVGDRLVVTLFCEGGYLFFLDPTHPSTVQRLSPTDSWQQGDMILANQAGEWVVTSGMDEDLSVLNAIVPAKLRTEASELTRADAAPLEPTPHEPAAQKSTLIEQNARDVRAVIFWTLLGLGVWEFRDLASSSAVFFEHFLAQSAAVLYPSIDSH